MRTRCSEHNGRFGGDEIFYVVIKRENPNEIFPVCTGAFRAIPIGLEDADYRGEVNIYTAYKSWRGRLIVGDWVCSIRSSTLRRFLPITYERMVGRSLRLGPPVSWLPETGGAHYFSAKPLYRS